MKAVIVEAPARLHMGFVTLNQPPRRWMGIGLAIKEPATVISATKLNSQSIKCVGFGAERVSHLATRVAKALGLKSGVRIEIKRAPSAHIGLGSTTQLSLAIASALSGLAGKEVDVDYLAKLTGRGIRSWIGVAAFKAGGFIIDFGDKGDSSAREFLRLTFPEEWAILLAIPKGVKGLDENEESSFLDAMKYSEEETKYLRELVTDLIVPSMIRGDLRTFGEGVSLLQTAVGKKFESVQGGTIRKESSMIARLLEELGLVGIGQSSWGPTVFGFSDDLRKAEDVANEVMAKIRDVEIIISKARNEGATLRIADTTEGIP